jgi:hypothetical protein
VSATFFAEPPERRFPFFVHVDEFQTFSSEAFASLVSEARKFATHFCLGTNTPTSSRLQRTVIIEPAAAPSIVPTDDASTTATAQ